MKLVFEMIDDNSGIVSYITFDGKDKKEAIDRLHEIMKHNSSHSNWYWEENNIYTEKLAQFVNNKDWERNIEPPIRPIMNMRKFCGIEVMESDGYEYSVITLEEWIEQHKKEM